MDVSGIAYSRMVAFHVRRRKIPPAYAGVRPDDVLRICLKNLLALHSATLVWPSWETLMFHEPKLGSLRHAQKIAAAVTRTPYPKVTLLPYSEDLASLKEPDDWRSGNPQLVYKRGYSSCGDHVFDMSLPTSRAALANRLKLDALFFRQRPSFRKMGVLPQWFAIPHIPELCSMGEARVFFIGGQLSHVVGTIPGKRQATMSCESVELLAPLGNLK